MTDEAARKRLKELDSKLGTYYDALTDNLTRELDRISTTGLSRLVSRLSSDLTFNDAGFVTPTRENALRLSKLDSEFTQISDDLGRRKAITAFVAEFPGQLPNLAEQLSVISGQLKGAPINAKKILAAPSAQQILQSQQKMSLEEMYGVAARVALKARERVMLNYGALDRETMSDTLSQSLGRSVGETRTLGATALAMFHRVANERVMEEADPNGELRYVYDGPDDDLTRPFCQKLKLLMKQGKSWTRKEIEAMDNGQLADCFTTGGGYNCRHQWRLALPDEAPAHRPISLQKQAGKKIIQAAATDAQKGTVSAAVQSVLAKSADDIAQPRTAGEQARVKLDAITRDHESQLLEAAQQAGGDPVAIAKATSAIIDKQREAIWSDDKALQVPVEWKNGLLFGKWNDAKKRSVQEAMEAFGRIVGEGALPKNAKPLTVKYKKTDRAYYDGKNINVDETTPTEVIIHEMGHWLEDQNPEIHKEAVEFLLRRTKGEPELSMAKLTGNDQYNMHETGLRDKFRDAYVGKLYRSSDIEVSLKEERGEPVDPAEKYVATEVLSTGLQWLYENPAAFAKEDPEHFEFTIGVLKRHRNATAPKVSPSAGLSVQAGLKDVKDSLFTTVGANPYKPSQSSYASWNLWKPGMTVGEALAAAPDANAKKHFYHAVNAGYIKINDPNFKVVKWGEKKDAAPAPAKPPKVVAPPVAPAPKPAPVPPPAPAPVATKKTYVTIEDFSIKTHKGKKLEIVAKGNPFKAGSQYASDFAKWKDGMTVGDAASQVKYTKILHESVAKGYIKVVDGETAASATSATTPVPSKPGLPKIVIDNYGDKFTLYQDADNPSFSYYESSEGASFSADYVMKKVNQGSWTAQKPQNPGSANVEKVKQALHKYYQDSSSVTNDEIQAMGWLQDVDPDLYQQLADEADAAQLKTQKKAVPPGMAEQYTSKFHQTATWIPETGEYKISEDGTYQTTVSAATMKTILADTSSEWKSPGAPAPSVTPPNGMPKKVKSALGFEYTWNGTEYEANGGVKASASLVQSNITYSDWTPVVEDKFAAGKAAADKLAKKQTLEKTEAEALNKWAAAEPMEYAQYVQNAVTAAKQSLPKSVKSPGGTVYTYDPDVDEYVDGDGGFYGKDYVLKELNKSKSQWVDLDLEIDDDDEEPAPPLSAVIAHTWKKKPTQPTLGGAHAKEVWVDESGEDWLFKPAERGKEIIPWAEETAAKVAKLVNPDLAVEAQTVTLNGTFGSIQKMTPTAAKKDFTGGGGNAPIPLSQITPKEFQQIQREHVIDWLISNHDGHPGQFLRGADGNVYGIDKAQAYKHLGKDELSIDYHPNSAYGEQEPIYNTIFRAVKQGSVKLDPNDTLAAIEAVEAISDAAFLEAVEPYASHLNLVGADPNTFKQLALARKHSIRADFEKFYAEVFKKPGFKFAKKAPAVQSSPREAAAVTADDKPLKPGQFLDAANRRVIRQAVESKWQGKSLNIDKDQIEDQNVLVWGEKDKGGETRTMLSLKVRPGKAQEEVLRRLGVDLSKITPAAVAAPTQSEFDVVPMPWVHSKHLFKKMVSGAVTLDSPDSAYVDGFGKPVPADKIAETKALYKQWKSDYDAAVKAKKKAKPEPPEQTAAQPKDFTVETHQGVFVDTRVQNHDGSVTVSGKNVPMSSVWDGFDSQLRQYEVKWSDGTKLRYLPYQPHTDHRYAYQGTIEMSLTGNPTEERVETALSHLSELGLKTQSATAVDNEMMYLEKQAYVVNAHKSPEWLTMKQRHESKNVPDETRVADMRAFWNRRLGVPDVTKLPEYNPGGNHATKYDDANDGAGWRTQYRFDISAQTVEREMRDFELFHDPRYGGSTLERLYGLALNQNNTMVSNIEKLRSGIVRDNTGSAVADVSTGGAQYVYTRIKQKEATTSGIYWKIGAIRRMDAITYGFDNFGSTKDNNVEKNRKSQPSEWKTVHTNNGNETIFKHGLHLLKDVSRIVPEDDAHRNRILKAFRDRGVTRFPDGRAVEDVVVKNKNKGRL